MPKPVEVHNAPERKKDYAKHDLYNEWLAMPLIPDSYSLHGVPAEVLNGMGWRETNGVSGMGAGYFIPYFNASKTAIPFAQVRHLSGNRRFTMLPNSETIMYGLWNLQNTDVIFVVEGPSDAAVMEACGYAAVAIPSASLTTMAVSLAHVCKKRAIKFIYAGDTDEAGKKLKKAIDDIYPYREIKQPDKYKDWGEFCEDTDVFEVSVYLSDIYTEDQPQEKEDIVAVAHEIFEELKYVPPSQR